MYLLRLLLSVLTFRPPILSILPFLSRVVGRGCFLVIRCALVSVVLLVLGFVSLAKPVAVAVFVDSGG